IGSAARAEASAESDVDWNALLDELHLLRSNQRGSGFALLDPGATSNQYCTRLASRDKQVRAHIDFDALIDALVEESRSIVGQGTYRRLPRRDGSAGERLRAFAKRELLR